MGKVKLIIILVIVAIISNSLYNTFRDGEIPDLPQGHWGSLKAETDTKIYPFKINVPDKDLQYFKSKLGDELSSNRLRDPLENIGFEYGFNTKYLKTILEYWHKKYDWRVREKLLNKYPQFKTKISGIDIHFQHIKDNGNGKYKKTFPILIVHGWPGSFVELQKIIPLLSQPENSDFNFELIIPSLPGYGFSEGAIRPGLGPLEISRLFFNLMERLGHKKFYLQGGDWGSLIVTHMATRYPQNVMAVHSNICFSMHSRQMLRTFIQGLFPSLFMTPEEIKRFPSFGEFFKFFVRETGYLHLQATKPDTVGVGLSQSPSGLAAYILEKFSTWTNESGLSYENGLIDESDFTLDELLDNVMVYWVTNSITTSMRLYSEGFNGKEFSSGMDSVPVKVPTGCMQTHDPYTSQSRWVLGDKYPNIVHYTMAPKGGHFMAMEQPTLLADDVLAFIKHVQNN